jgi:hypothetical protein
MFALIAVAASVYASPLRAQDVDALRQDTLVAAAERAARAWLQQIDEGRWDDAWSLMIDMMRNSVSKSEWRATIERGRAPFQPMGERSLIAATRTSDFTGSLAVQLVFRIASPGKPIASETIVLSPSPAGWRVAAIGIRREDGSRAARIPAASRKAPNTAGYHGAMAGTFA